MTTLYCILARGADTGVIFRRGPSKLVRLIGWNLKTDTFEPGQWFKGRIYARRSDLSPDGTKLVTLAARHHGKLPAWIAVSTPPFLTAHVLWPALGTSADLSLFETDSVLALSTYSHDGSLAPAEGFAVPRQLRVKPKPWPGYFYKLADHDRLVRDGWVVHGGDPVYRGTDAPVVYRKQLLGGSHPAWLDMSAMSEAKLSYAVRDEHGGCLDLVADWADISGEAIVFAQGGTLSRVRIERRGVPLALGQPEQLGDFSAMTFEPIEAPDWAKHW